MRQLSLLLLLSVAMLCSASTLRVKRDASRNHCPQVRDRTECLSTIDSRFNQDWLRSGSDCVWCITDCDDGNLCEPRGFLEKKGKRAGIDFETGVMRAERRYNPTDLFVHVAKEVTFDEAEEWCWQLGMELAVINNSAENDFIRQLAWDNKPTAGSGYPWIGLKKRRGEYLWSNRREPTYTNWRDDFCCREPSERSDCVLMRPWSGEWQSAYSCSEANPFVCSEHQYSPQTKK